MTVDTRKIGAMSVPEPILLSYFPVPSTLNGSWNKALEVYLEAVQAPITVACPTRDPAHVPSRNPAVRYLPLARHHRHFDCLLKRNRFHFLAKSICHHIETHEGVFRVSLFDNLGLLHALDTLARARHLRHRLEVVYFLHTFSYLLEPSQSSAFYRRMDTAVFLTRRSFDYEMQRTHEISCQVKILSNGVDETRFAPLPPELKTAKRRALGIPDDAVVFLWSSADRPKKGLDFLLSFWPRFSAGKKAVLLVVGATRTGALPANVRFIGPVPQGDIHAYYQLAEVYLFPTLCNEGQPLSILEAMACGLPVIAHPLGGIPEMFADGAGILLERSHDEEAWGTAMGALYSDQNARQRLGQNNRRLVEARYRMRDWLKAFDQIVRYDR